VRLGCQVIHVHGMLRCAPASQLESDQGVAGFALGNIHC
jgi:hypothetical protein